MDVFGSIQGHQGDVDRNILARSNRRQRRTVVNPLVLDSVTILLLQWSRGA